MNAMMTVRETIKEALEEAVIMECAREEFDRDNMILTAMRLSGAPFSFVEIVASEQRI